MMNRRQAIKVGFLAALGVVVAPVMKWIPVPFRPWVFTIKEIDISSRVPQFPGVVGCWLPPAGIYKLVVLRSNGKKCELNG